MKPIGEKIKMLRKEKGYSQENLLGPGRNSHVSKIELGKLKPSQSILMDIAKELKINFQELINETDWEFDTGSSENKNKVEFGFAPGVANIKLEPTGEITFSPIFYKIYEKDGRENLFCPKSGVPLKRRCAKFFVPDDDGLPFLLIKGICGKPYDDPAAKYCTACGDALLGIKLQSLIKKVGQITAPNNFATDKKDNLLFQNLYLKLIDQIDTDISSMLQSTSEPLVFDRFYQHTPHEHGGYQFDDAVRDSLKEKYPVEYAEISYRFCGGNLTDDELRRINDENKKLQDDPIGCLNKRENSDVRSIRSYFESMEKDKEYFRSILIQIREYGLAIDANNSSESENNKKITKEKR